METFLIVLGPGHQRWGCHHSWFLVKACSLLTFHYIFTWWERQDYSKDSYNGTNYMRVPPLWLNCLSTKHPLHWASLFQHINYVVVQSPCCVQFFATPLTAAHQASLSFTISQSFLKFMFIASVMPSSHLILWHSLLLLPSIFSNIRESAVRIRWPKYWSFSFSLSSSNKYSGLITLKIDWFDLLAVQGTFKSLL